MNKEKRKKLRLYIVRVGRTKFKVLAANCESADRIAGRTLGGIWSKRITETWKMD
jgi:hypothetical protein